MNVELIGGRFDGFEGEISPECVKVGFLLIGECPRHGENQDCGCDDEMLYGYYAEPDKGAGQFIPKEGRK